MNTLTHFAAAMLVLALTAAHAMGAAFRVSEEGGQISIATSNYRLEIVKNGCRYGFMRPDGKTILPSHATSGLEFAGGAAVETKLRSQDKQKLVLEVASAQGERATVEIEFPR